MNKNKVDKLKSKGWEIKGWEIGDTQDFLDLNDSEMKYIEMKITLGKFLKSQREKNGYSQSRLANEIHSSQSRVAKMEKGDTSVSIDSIFKSLLHLNTPLKKVSKELTKLD